MNGDEQADISAREYARKWLPPALRDAEMRRDIKKLQEYLLENVK